MRRRTIRRRPDIYTVGTIGTVLQLLKLPDGTVKVLVEGGQRARIGRFAENEAFFQAHADIIGEKSGAPQEVEALARTVVAQFEQYIKLNKKIPPEVLVSINQIDDPGKLADTVASHLTLKDPGEAGAAGDRSGVRTPEKVFGYMEGEIGVLQVRSGSVNRVKRQMEKTQRESTTSTSSSRRSKESSARARTARTRWSNSKTRSTRPSSLRKPTTRRWRSSRSCAA